MSSPGREGRGFAAARPTPKASCSRERLMRSRGGAKAHVRPARQGARRQNPRHDSRQRRWLGLSQRRAGRASPGRCGRKGGSRVSADTVRACRAAQSSGRRQPRPPAGSGRGQCHRTAGPDATGSGRRQSRPSRHQPTPPHQPPKAPARPARVQARGTDRYALDGTERV